MNTFDFNTLKKLHEKGTDRQTDRRTLRLYDRIGPVGRFDEKMLQIIDRQPFCMYNLPTPSNSGRLYFRIYHNADSAEMLAFYLLPHSCLSCI